MTDSSTRSAPSPAQQAVATALMFNDTIAEHMLAEELRELVDKVLYRLSLLDVDERMEAMGMDAVGLAPNTEERIMLYAERTRP